MDRKKGTGAPPGELGSFDLTKMSEAEVAAQIAARMAQWRRARKPADAPARGPPADRPTAGQAAIHQYTPPLSLDEAATVRIDRALRMATGRLGPQTEEIRTRSTLLASAYRTDFRALLAEGPNVNAAGMRPAKGRIDQVLGRARAIGAVVWRALRRGANGRMGQALGRARAIGVTAWHAPVHWPVIAGAALIAAAIAGWILVPPGRTVAPEAASTRKIASPLVIVHPPAVVHPPEPTPAIAGPAGKPTPALQALMPTRQEAIPPDKAAARALVTLKAEQHRPTLVARLKPAKPTAALANTKPDGQATARPEARQQGTAPLNATPQPPQAPAAADQHHRTEQ